MSSNLLLTETPVLTKNSDGSLSCSFKAAYCLVPPSNFTISIPGASRVIRVPPFTFIAFLKCKGYLLNGSYHDGIQGQSFTTQTNDIPTAPQIIGTVTLSALVTTDPIFYIRTELILQQPRMQNSDVSGVTEYYEFGTI
jgi:hypothetical protein